MTRQGQAYAFAPASSVTRALYWIYGTEHTGGPVAGNAVGHRPERRREALAAHE